MNELIITLFIISLVVIGILITELQSKKKLLSIVKSDFEFISDEYAEIKTIHLNLIDKTLSVIDSLTEHNNKTCKDFAEDLSMAVRDSIIQNLKTEKE